MSTFNAGSIEAKLALGRTSWTRDLKKTQAEIDRLERTTITVGIDADDTNARIVMDNIELLLDDLDAQTYTPTIDANTQPAEDALARLEALAQGIDTDKIVIAVDADTDNAVIQLDNLEAFLAVLDGEEVNIKVEVDSADAELKLIGIATLMQNLSLNDLNIDVNLQGYVATMARLADLQLQIAAVDHNDIDVKVNYDKNNLESLIGSGAGAGATGGGQLGLLELAMILIIGLAPILGVAIGAATAAIVGFVAAAVAALGPLVILGLGLFYLYKQFVNAKKAGGELTAPMQMLADSMANFKEVMDNLPDFSKAGFGLMAHGIDLLAKIVPTLVPIFKPTVKVIEDLFQSISDWVDSPGYKDFIGFFQGFGIDMLKAFIIIIGNLLKFFGGLFGAFEPFARIMMKGLEGVTKSWADWSANLEHNKGFQHFIDNAIHYGPLVLHMFGELWRALMNIAHSLEPFAGPMLAGLTKFFTFIADMDPHSLGLLVELLAAGFIAFKVIIPAISTFVDLIGGVVEGVGAVATALEISVGALFFWIAVIAAVVLAVLYFWNTNKEFRDDVIKIWNDIINTVKPIIEDIVGLIREHWGSIVKWASDVWGSIQDIVVNAMGIIQQIVFFATTAISWIWKHFGGDILKIVMGMVRAVAGQIRGMFEILAGIFKLINDVLHGRWSKVWGDILQILHGALTVVVSSLRGLKDMALGIFGLIWHGVSLLWTHMWDNLKSQVSSGWQHIEDAFATAMHWLGGLGGRIGNAVAGAWDGLISGFKNAINTIIGWWNGLSFHIPGFDPPGPGPKFGGFDFSPPNISPLAAGAYVTEPMLAVIGEGGEPEIVTPESKMRQIVSEHAGDKMDYGKLAGALVGALAPLFGNLLTADMLEKILREAGPTVKVDASNDDKSAHALAHAMAFQLRLLGYGAA